MSELLNRMQGAIHSAVAREKAGFSGAIPWRVVQSWIVLVKNMEYREQLLLEKRSEFPPLPIDGQLAEYDDLREAQ